MSKITNLIGTTWRLDGATLYGLSAEYGLFNITTNGVLTQQKVLDDGTIDSSGSMPVSEGFEFACGYFPNIEDGGATVIGYESSLCVKVTYEGDVAWMPLNMFLTGAGFNCVIIYEFTITGGDDISNPLFIDFINTYGTLVSGGEPPTAEGVKSKLQSLITASNAKTGKSDANLTDAVKTLLEGYGQGGGGEVEFNIAYGETEPTDTSKLWVKTSEPSAASVTTNVVADKESRATLDTTLPTAAMNIAAATVGTKVYLFGGMGDNGSLNTINVFDTKTNTITTLSTTLPTGAQAVSAAVVGTKVYLFGGMGSSRLNTINVFDTANNTITTLSTTLPTSAMYVTAAAVGTKVYLFGGSSGSSTSLNTINVFDTKTNTITTLSVTLPKATQAVSAAVVGTKVYLFGGCSGSSSYLNTINVFDTTTNAITTLSVTLPKAAQSIAAAVVGTKVYLFGGVHNSNLNTINAFDTETNTITTLSIALPTNTGYIAAAVVGTKVYLFGGFGSSRLNTINLFSVAFSLTTNNLLIEATVAKNTFNLLPNVELGVNAVYLGNADGVAETVAAALYVDGAWAEI